MTDSHRNMRRSAISLTAAVCGFIHLFLAVTVVQCQTGWGVKCWPTNICALIGSTVEVNCNYMHPQQVNDNEIIVKERFWFRKASSGIFVDLRSDPDCSDRIEYECGNKTCLLRIKDLRENDSAEYKFRFTTNQERGKMSGGPITLSATGLRVHVSRTYINLNSYSAELKCESRCPLPGGLHYSWMKNQQIIPGPTAKTFSCPWCFDNSVSCGVADQRYSSPEVWLNGHWDVKYAATEICAYQGSTAKIPCSYRYPSKKYGRHTTVTQVLWYIKENKGVYMDLKGDAAYSNRVRYASGENDCTLIIYDLKRSDSAVYKFRFITNVPGGHFTGQPGVSLSVTDPKLQTRVRRSIFHPSHLNWIELSCHSNCEQSDHSYTWYRDGKMFGEEKSFVLLQTVTSADRYHCAIKHHQQFPSPQVYGPTPPLVSLDPSSDIVEGCSVTLSCSSDANPPATYSWYKRGQFIQDGAELHVKFVESSDSRQYSCVAENELGRSQSQGVHIDVKYAPKSPSVSVSPPGDIVVGNSVTLRCSSDANPPATYTWHKEKQTLSGQQKDLHFASITYKDQGNYYCKSENPYGWTNSTLIYLDVQYSPNLPLVSQSPPGVINEGHSVNLTCSSDANPAANYSWYKEGEDSPKASGQTFMVASSTSELSGTYYCLAKNKMGHSKSNSTVLTIIPAFPQTLVAIGIPLLVVLLMVPLCVFLLMRIRMWKTSKSSSKLQRGPDKSEGAPPTQQEESDLHYASIHFVKTRTDPIYSNTTASGSSGQTQEEVEVQYTTVTVHCATSTTRCASQEPLEDPSALYGNVQKDARA